MNEYLGEYVAIYPSCRAGQVGRMRFLLVTNETKRQVKAKESANSVGENTIQKTEILGIIEPTAVNEKRIAARDIQNEYHEERRKLRTKYLKKMMKLHSSINLDK